MAFEKQSKFDGVSLGVEWPEPPQPITCAGKQVIGAEDFARWLSEFSLAMSHALESGAKEIESLKSAGK
jgi:hypothetical protein